jgi:hypothetical protein
MRRYAKRRYFHTKKGKRNHRIVNKDTCIKEGESGQINMTRHLY